MFEKNYNTVHCFYALGKLSNLFLVHKEKYLQFSAFSMASSLSSGQACAMFVMGINVLTR